jgi:hypothetical protein
MISFLVFDFVLGREWIFGLERLCDERRIPREGKGM